MKLGAIILAGGYSSRMNGFKPLMKLGGRSLLERSARLFSHVGLNHIIVVTGHRQLEVKAEADRLGLKAVHNKNYDGGMYSSVKAGANQMKQLTGLDGFFLLPVDIPLIRFATISTLCHQKRGNYIVYPTFLGERGHPPLIPARLINAILDYSGKGGLKRLLERHSSIDVPVWDEGILLDADKPEDFCRLKKRLLLMDKGSRREAKALARVRMRKKGQAHGEAVAEVACSLGRALNRLGYGLDTELLFNGGLLHDIAKGCKHHEQKGAEILSDLGFTGLAPIVAAHRDTGVPQSGMVTEKEMICLADKLVRGTTRMPVETRFAEKLMLYESDPEASHVIKKRLGNMRELERIVVTHLGQRLEEMLEIEEQP